MVLNAMVLNTIRFFFSSLIAHMATILINFQQKFALVRSFQELLSAIARSNLARKNDVTDFARLYIHVQNDLLRLASISFGSAS